MLSSYQNCFGARLQEGSLRALDRGRAKAYCNIWPTPCAHLLQRDWCYSHWWTHLHEWSYISCPLGYSGTSVWVKHKGGDKHSSKPSGTPELTQRLWMSQALKACVAMILPLSPWSCCLCLPLEEWLSRVCLFLSASRNSASQGLKTSSVFYLCCQGDSSLYSSHPMPSFIPNGKGLAPWRVTKASLVTGQLVVLKFLFFLSFWKNSKYITCRHSLNVCEKFQNKKIIFYTMWLQESLSICRHFFWVSWLSAARPGPVLKL